MKILWAFFTLTVLQINLSSEQVKTQNWDEFKVCLRFKKIERREKLHFGLMTL